MWIYRRRARDMDEHAIQRKLGADETTALQGGRAKDAQLCRPGISASRAGLFAVADGDTP